MDVVDELDKPTCCLVHTSRVSSYGVNIEWYICAVISIYCLELNCQQTDSTDSGDTAVLAGYQSDAVHVLCTTDWSPI
jgi:hypothetical protein